MNQRESLHSDGLGQVSAFGWVPDFARGNGRLAGPAETASALTDYLRRGLARPAQAHALEAQLADFPDTPPFQRP